MKKTWIVGLICLLAGALVAVGIVSIIQGRQLSTEEEFARELEKFAVNGKKVTGEIVLPPEARGNLKIEHRIDEEALRWIGQFNLDARITNIGEKEILYFELVYFLTGREGNLHPESKETVRAFANFGKMTLEDFRRFSPHGALPSPPLGESIPVEISFGNLEDLWEPAYGFVIKIRELHFVGGPAVTEEPGPKEPEPILSPGQALKAFSEALKEGRYVEAGKYIFIRTLEGLNENPPPELQHLLPEITAAELIEEMAKMQRGANMTVEKIEVLEEEIYNDTAEVRCIVYLSDGTREESTIYMTKEEGIWKIEF